MFEIDPWLIVVVAVLIVTFLVIAVNWGVRAHRRKISAGKEALIGKTAEVNVALDPKGIVIVDGERWAALSEKGRVEPEEEVIITKVEGLKLYVIKKE